MENLQYKIFLYYGIISGAIILVLGLFNVSILCILVVLVLLMIEIIILGCILYKYIQDKCKEFNETKTKN